MPLALQSGAIRQLHGVGGALLGAGQEGLGENQMGGIKLEFVRN
jgi:hypothetical protein